MITFSIPLEQNRLRMAYNNDILRFASSWQATPQYAEIALTATGSPATEHFRARIYPNPQNGFFFNLKPYATALLNTRNFEDLTPGEIGQDATYGFTGGTYMSLTLTIGVYFSETSIDTASHTLHWLAGVEQPGRSGGFQATVPLLLSPLAKGSTDRWYFKYWQGYPFDIAFYSPGSSLSLTNTSNQLSASFPVPEKATRLFFSDGRTDESLENLLPLAEGRNELTFNFSGTRRYATLEKVPYRHGAYLKWLNQYGGYSYWLFEDTWSADRSVKYLGELERDNANLGDTRSRTLPIGKESQDTIKVVAELLTPADRDIVEGLLDSPRIYLFTGSPFSRNGHNNWIEVALKTTGARIKNPRQPLTNFTFDLELPARYTQTI